MKKGRLLLLSLVIASITFICIPNAKSAGEGIIDGVLRMETPVKDISKTMITVFDSKNAEIIKSNFTIDPSTYEFYGYLPAGLYKLHFSYSYIGEICFQGFFVRTLINEITEGFDLGTSIGVTENTHTSLGEIVIKPDKCFVVSCSPESGKVSGYVRDSRTSSPIQGIEVHFKDPITAFPIYGFPNDTQAITDANGYYSLARQNICNGFQVKIRFYDPQNLYIASYYNLNSVDIFGQGATVDFVGNDIENPPQLLAGITPSTQIGDLIVDIENILPSVDAEPIVSSLLQGKTLLDDTNPNNDKGACGVLNGAIAKFKKLVSNGGLTQAEADELAASVEKIRNDLGCK